MGLVLSSLLTLEAHMTITLAQLKGYARLAVGGSPSTAPGVTEAERLTEIVNGAGEHLFSRPWRWRERTAGGFDFTANQAFIDLSVDGSGNAISVDEVISLKPADTIKFSIDLVSPATFEDFKRTNVETSLFYVATMARSAQTTLGLPAARLDLFPTPSTSTDDAIFIRYREGWPSYTTTSSETSNIPVPSFCEQLLIEYVRAFAEGSEDGTTQARIVAVDGGTLLDQALRKDGITTSDMGSLPMNRGFFLDDNTILAGVSQPGVSQGFELMWRGVWSSTASYTQDDLVRLDRDVYIATANSTGQTPPNTDFWDIFCLGGLNGAGGSGGSGGGGGGISSVNGISDTDNDGNIVLAAANVGAANISHQHSQGDVTNLISDLADKPNKATINNITDVDTTGVQDDQVLQWDDSASKWKPSTLSGGGSSAVNSVNGETGTVVLDLNDLQGVTVSSTSNGQALVVNALGAWSNQTITLALNDLSNVSAATPATDQLIAWSGSAWTAVTRPKSINGQTGATVNLGTNDLSDVTISSVGANEVIMRNANNDAWTNRTLAEAGIAAASHSHSIGEINGLQGALNDKSPTNHTHAIADLSNVSGTTPTNGQVLKFNDQNSQWEPAADATGGGGGGSLPSGSLGQLLVHNGSAYVSTTDDAFMPAPGAGTSTATMGGNSVKLRKKAWSPAHGGLADVYRKSFFMNPASDVSNSQALVLPTALNSFSELIEVAGYGIQTLQNSTIHYPVAARRPSGGTDINVEAEITGTTAVLTCRRGTSLDEAADGFLIVVDLTAPVGVNTVQTISAASSFGGSQEHTGTFPSGQQPRVGMIGSVGTQPNTVTAVNLTDSSTNTWQVTYTHAFSASIGDEVNLTMPTP